MPFVSAVPAPVPFWVQDMFWPSLLKTDTTNTGLNTNAWAWRPYLNEPPTSATPITLAGNSAAGGGDVARLELFRGVPFALHLKDHGEQWRPPLLPACLNPGLTMGNLITREDWRVVWYRMPWTDGGSTGAATSGHVWSFDVAAPAGIPWAASGTAVQQLGVYGNGAGGVEYRSYSSAPALLETVALAGYNAGVWNTFDHVFISSAPGRDPRYNLYLNGTLVVDRPFGTALLPYVTAPRQQLITQVAAGIDLYLAYIRARGGRFGPDGREYLS